MSITLAFVAATLFGIGTYLVLQHTLSRILIGIALITHGANVLLMGAGRRGAPPIVGTGDPTDFSDPLPQALALTAIVISFGVSGLLLALAYRSWLLTHDDEVEDDVADRAIASRRLTDVDEDDKDVADAGDLDDLDHPELLEGGPFT